VVAADALPDRARCEVVFSSLGDLRVKLAVVAPDPKAAGPARAALDSLPAAVRGMFTEVPDPTASEWRLVAEGSQLVLRQGPQPRAEQANDSEPNTLADRAIVRYDLQDPVRLAGRLALDLQKVFKWQNVWRVAGEFGKGPSSGRGQGLDLEVRKLAGPNERTGEPLAGRPLRPGDWIEIRLANSGQENLWVTLLYLDPNFGIREIPVGSLEAGAAMRPLRTDVTDESFGAEGLVALAAPSQSHRDRPHFKFLLQEPLGLPGGIPERPRGRTARTPFEQLMEDVAFGSQSRGLGFRDMAQPVIASETWVTTPRGQDTRSGEKAKADPRK